MVHCILRDNKICCILETGKAGRVRLGGVVTDLCYNTVLKITRNKYYDQVERGS